MPTTSITPYCPSSSHSFYICTDTTNHFAGCCSTNPCSNDGICPPASLGVTSYDPLAYNTFPAQECEAGGTFYSCNYGGKQAPFIGCCKSNPCGDGATCPDSDLVGMKLASDQGNAQAFLSGAGFLVQPSSTLVPGAPVSATVGGRTGATGSLTVPFRPTTVTSNTVTTGTTSSPSTVMEAQGKSGVSKAAIAGISIASVALAAGVFLIAFFLLCRRRKRGVLEKNGSMESVVETAVAREGGSGHGRGGEAAEAYPDLPPMKEWQPAAGSTPPSGKFFGGHAFGRDGRLESAASDDQDNAEASRSSRYYAPQNTPTPPPRAAVRDSHASMQSQTTKRSSRPSIPLFYAHQQLTADNNNDPRNSNNSNRSQPPVIPNRNSSQNFSYPQQALQAPKPSKIPIFMNQISSTPQNRAQVHHQRPIISMSASQYASTIRPVSLTPVYENEQAPQSITNQQSPQLSNTTTRFYASPQDLSANGSPTMSKMDATFGVTPTDNERRTNPLREPQSRTSPVGPTSPKSPAFGTISVTSPQAIRDLQAQNHARQQSQLQSKSRLSGPGVTRFSEATISSQTDGMMGMGNMTVQHGRSGGSTTWAKDGAGKWYRQGVGVESLPG